MNCLKRLVPPVLLGEVGQGSFLAPEDVVGVFRGSGLGLEQPSWGRDEGEGVQVVYLAFSGSTW